MDKIKKLQVEAIKKGTVIDHIPAGQGLKIINHLQLVDKNLRLTVGLNLISADGQCKDIIKVNDWHLTKQQANNMYLFAPNASVNQIDEYKVVNKFKMTAPKELVAVFDCQNQNCISLTEAVKSRFYVSENTNNQELKLQCHYCERWFRDFVFV